MRSKRDFGAEIKSYHEISEKSQNEKDPCEVCIILIYCVENPIGHKNIYVIISKFPHFVHHLNEVEEGCYGQHMKTQGILESLDLGPGPPQLFT